jgi:hypothetical protein
MDTSGRERLQKAEADVEAALERLAASLRAGKPEDVVEYLRFWGRFTRFSFHNTLLILSQRPSATHVAGFRAWRKVGRFVRKGEKGIAILCPRLRVQEDKKTGEEERFLSGFRVGYVFDEAQTDGEPLRRLRYGGRADDRGTSAGSSAPSKGGGFWFGSAVRPWRSGFPARTV